MSDKKDDKLIEVECDRCDTTYKIRKDKTVRCRGCGRYLN